MMEIATFILILCLVLILTVYNRRQAHALEYMARLEEYRPLVRSRIAASARRVSCTSSRCAGWRRWSTHCLMPRLP